MSNQPHHKSPSAVHLETVQDPVHAAHLRELHNMTIQESYGHVFTPQEYKALVPKSLGMFALDETVTEPVIYSSEFFRGQDKDSESRIGGAAVSGMFISEEHGPMDALRSWGDSLALTELHINFGPESPLNQIASVLGIRTSREGEWVAASGLEEVADINIRFKQLGLDDRQLVTFHGKTYSSEYLLASLAKGEIPVSDVPDQTAMGVHDKVFHLMGFAMMAQGVFSAVRQLAGERLSRFNKAIQDYDPKNMNPKELYEASESSKIEYYAARDLVSELTREFDASLTRMAAALTYKKSARNDILAIHISDLLGIEHDSSLAKILVKDTLTHAEALKKRADAILSI